jgi:hypothetical protein
LVLPDRRIVLGRDPADDAVLIRQIGAMPEGIYSDKSVTPSCWVHVVLFGRAIQQLWGALTDFGDPGHFWIWLKMALRLI